MARDRPQTQDSAGSSSAGFLRTGVFVTPSPDLDWLRSVSNWAEPLLSPQKRPWKHFPSSSFSPPGSHPVGGVVVGWGLPPGLLSGLMCGMTLRMGLISLEQQQPCLTVLMPAGCWLHHILTATAHAGDAVSWGCGGGGGVLTHPIRSGNLNQSAKTSVRGREALPHESPWPRRCASSTV